MNLVDNHKEERRRSFNRLSTRLAALRDDELSAWISTADWRRSIHGSQSAILDLEGDKVFVKQIALTDLERSAGASTANHFGLPLFYQYGVGSAGFGARRELDAYLEAGTWALSGECLHFMHVYHWRELPRAAGPALAPDRQALLENLPSYWDSSEAVRGRLGAIAGASRAIVLFLESLPQTLDDWLQPRLGSEPPDAVTEALILRFHDQLDEAAEFMNARGMLHFDLHAHNLLTDGERLYITDFGLTICDSFDLSPAERTFYETHRLYDRGYVRWLFWSRLSSKSLTPALSALAEQCGPAGAVLDRFFRRLSRESKATPYPAKDIEAALQT